MVLSAHLRYASVDFTTVDCCAAEEMCPADVPPYALKRELRAYLMI